MLSANSFSMYKINFEGWMFISDCLNKLLGVYISNRLNKILGDYFLPMYMNIWTLVRLLGILEFCRVGLMYANLHHCENKIDFSFVEKSFYCGGTLKFSTRCAGP